MRPWGSTPSGRTTIKEPVPLQLLSKATWASTPFHVPAATVPSSRYCRRSRSVEMLALEGSMAWSSASKIATRVDSLLYRLSFARRRTVSEPAASGKSAPVASASLAADASKYKYSAPFCK